MSGKRCGLWKDNGYDIDGNMCILIDILSLQDAITEMTVVAPTRDQLPIR